MISVFIQAGDDPVGLSRTLAALVPGAVEGLVREAVVLVDEETEGVRRVAEHAGCRVRPASELSAALGEARGEWLLVMRAGARPASGWVEAVSQHLEAQEGVPGAARFRPAKRPGKSFLARLLRRPDALSCGVLLQRREAVAAVSRAGSLERLAASVRARPINVEMHA